MEVELGCCKALLEYKGVEWVVDVVMVLEAEWVISSTECSDAG